MSSRGLHFVKEEVNILGMDWLAFEAYGCQENFDVIQQFCFLKVDFSNMQYYNI